MMRWSAKRKAWIVGLMRDNPAAAKAFMDQYEISADELIQWESAYARGGIHALMIRARGRQKEARNG